MVNANTAGFRFKDYKISRFSFEHIEDNNEEGLEETVKINFSPSGEYHEKTGEFILILKVTGLSDTEEKKEVINLDANATFKFEDNFPFDQIPEFFYKNSIAIFFPYLRAFISTITLQSNGPLLILNVMNLSNLEKPLISNTKCLKE